jgi:hypothetical protein
MDERDRSMDKRDNPVDGRGSNGGLERQIPVGTA